MSREMARSSKKSVWLSLVCAAALCGVATSAWADDGADGLGSAPMPIVIKGGAREPEASAPAGSQGQQQGAGGQAQIQKAQNQKAQNQKAPDPCEPKGGVVGVFQNALKNMGKDPCAH